MMGVKVSNGGMRVDVLEKKKKRVLENISITQNLGLDGGLICLC